MRKVLIVDDDVNIRRLFRCLLEKAGYEVCDADDGDVALKIFKAEPPDLIITDVLMPNKEGLELIQDIKNIQPDMRVIALSGGGGVLDTAECLAFADGFGADKVFAKPIKPNLLLDTVAALLPSQQAPQVSYVN